MNRKKLALIRDNELYNEDIYVPLSVMQTLEQSKLGNEVTNCHYIFKKVLENAVLIYNIIESNINDSCELNYDDFYYKLKEVENSDNQSYFLFVNIYEIAKKIYLDFFNNINKNEYENFIVLIEKYHSFTQEFGRLIAVYEFTRKQYIDILQQITLDFKEKQSTRDTKKQTHEDYFKNDYMFIYSKILTEYENVLNTYDSLLDNYNPIIELHGDSETQNMAPSKRL